MIKKFFSFFKNIFSSDVELTSPFAFPKINTDQKIKELKVNENAKIDGLKNLPYNDRNVLDANEEKIKGHFLELLRVTLRKARTSSNSLKGQITNLQIYPLYTKLESFEKETKNWFNEKKKETNDFDFKVTKEIEDAATIYKNFKTKNNLERLAKYPTSMSLFYAVLCIELIIESAINGAFFASVVTTGLIGGMGIALIISFFNVGVGFIYGKYCIPYFNHISVQKKLLASLGTIVVFFLYFIPLNLFVAHFRDKILVLKKLGQFEWSNLKLIDVINSTIESHFIVESTSSFVLIFIGIAAGLIALVVGYRSDDKYPGYGKIQKDYDTTLTKHGEAIWNYIEECNNEKFKKITDLENIVRNIRIKHKSVKQIMGYYEIFQKNFITFISQVEAAAHQVIMQYRAENMRHRSDRPPKYFEKKIELKEDTSIDANINDELEDIKKAEDIIDNVPNLQNHNIENIHLAHEDAISSVKHFEEFEKTIFRKS